MVYTRITTAIIVAVLLIGSDLFGVDMDADTAYALAGVAGSYIIGKSYENSRVKAILENNRHEVERYERYLQAEARTTFAEPPSE